MQAHLPAKEAMEKATEAQNTDKEPLPCRCFLQSPAMKFRKAQLTSSVVSARTLSSPPPD